jgi:hypothetical protein
MSYTVYISLGVQVEAESPERAVERVLNEGYQAFEVLWSDVESEVYSEELEEFIEA